MNTEESKKAFVHRHASRTFAFALFLIGGDRDKAYDVATSAFAEALKGAEDSDPEEAVFLGALRIILEKSRRVESIPRLDEDGAAASSEEKSMLKLVRAALASLSIDEKNSVLLRDQLGLGYRTIASVIGASEAAARNGTIQARAHLRKKVEEGMRNAR